MKLDTGNAMFWDTENETYQMCVSTKLAAKRIGVSPDYFRAYKKNKKNFPRPIEDTGTKKYYLLSELDTFLANNSLTN